MKRVSFLGAGSWGTALAILCAGNGHKVTIWSKIQSEIDMLRENREHVERLLLTCVLLHNWHNHISKRDRSWLMWEKGSKRLP